MLCFVRLQAEVRRRCETRTTIGCRTVAYQSAKLHTLLHSQFKNKKKKSHTYASDQSNHGTFDYYQNRLWREYSTYWLWPLRAPPIKVSRKFQEWKKEFVNNDYDDNEEMTKGAVVFDHLDLYSVQYIW